MANDFLDIFECLLLMNRLSFPHPREEHDGLRNTITLPHIESGVFFKIDGLGSDLNEPAGAGSIILNNPFGVTSIFHL